MSDKIIGILRLVESYLDLGRLDEAASELEKLTDEVRNGKKACVLRCRIFEATGHWDAMMDVAIHLVAIDPQIAQHWIWAATATRMAGSIELAVNILRLAGKFLSDDTLIRDHLEQFRRA